jgi:hypothetical protein
MKNQATIRSLIDSVNSPAIFLSPSGQLTFSKRTSEKQFLNYKGGENNENNEIQKAENAGEDRRFK